MKVTLNLTREEAETLQLCLTAFAASVQILKCSREKQPEVEAGYKRMTRVVRKTQNQLGKALEEKTGKEAAQ